MSDDTKREYPDTFDLMASQTRHNREDYAH